MDGRTSLKVSAINLAFLICGGIAGVYVRGFFPPSSVHAQQQFEEISPNISTASMAVGTLVAGRVATDQLTVQGVDLVKLHENTINYVSRYVGTADGWKGVIADSRAAKPLRMAAPKKDTPEPPKPEGKKDGAKQ